MPRDLSTRAPPPTAPDNEERSHRQLPSGSAAEDRGMEAIAAACESGTSPSRPPSSHRQVRKEPPKIMELSEAVTWDQQSLPAAFRLTVAPRKIEAMPLDEASSDFGTCTEPLQAQNQKTLLLPMSEHASHGPSVPAMARKETLSSIFEPYIYSSSPNNFQGEDASSDGYVTVSSDESDSRGDKVLFKTLPGSLVKTMANGVRTLAATGARGASNPHLIRGSSRRKLQTQGKGRSSQFLCDTKELRRLIKNMRAAAPISRRQKKKCRPGLSPAHTNSPAVSLRVTARKRAGRKFGVTLNTTSTLRNPMLRYGFEPFSCALKCTEETSARESFHGDFRHPPDVARKTSWRKSAMTVTDGLQSLCKVLQERHSTEAAPQRLPVISEEANSRPQQLENRQQTLQSFSLCTGHVAESPLDLAALNLRKIVSLKTGRSGESIFSVLMEDSASQVHLAMEPKVPSVCSKQSTGHKMASVFDINSTFESGKENVRESTPLHAGSSFCVQASKRQNQLGMQRRIVLSQLLPLTMENLAAWQALKPQPVALERFQEDPYCGQTYECGGPVCDQWHQNNVIKREDGISFDEYCNKILPEEWVRRRKALLTRRRSLLEGKLQGPTDLEMKQVLENTHGETLLVEPIQRCSEAIELYEEESAVFNAIRVAQWLVRVRPPEKFEPGGECKHSILSEENDLTFGTFLAPPNAGIPLTSTPKSAYTRHWSPKLCCPESGLTIQRSFSDTGLCLNSSSPSAYRALPSSVGRLGPKREYWLTAAKKPPDESRLHRRK